MQKGDSTVDLRKTASSDEDFGKDFLESWKSAKHGNDTVDFDMETVPKNKKNPFKFDDLNNFDLSGNFDKLPSFKLGIPELDFSGLSKKNEKTQEKSAKECVTGKKESKEGKFSFDFDFNSFDVSSNSPEDKRPGNCSEKNVVEYTSKHEKNRNSSYNISANKNIPRDQPSETQEPIEKRTAIAEDNDKETCVTTEHGEYHGMFLAKENSDNNQVFCLQCSGDGSLEADSPDIQQGTAPLTVVKPRLTTNKHDFLQPINSSSSRSSSPVDSYNSECRTKSSRKELLNPGSMLQKQQGHCQLTRISGSLIGSIPIREDYNSTGTKESIQKVKNIEEKQNSEQNLILPPLKSDSIFGDSIKLSGLTSTGLQSRTLSKLEDNLPKKSAVISKPINSIMHPTTKATHASNATECRTIQVNSNKPNSAIPREAKSVRFLEKKMECPLNAASKTANSTTNEKHVPLHAPLKRKIDEESIADLETSSPLKCVKESTANRRNSVGASPNTDRKMATEIKDAETCQNVVSVATLMSFTAVPAVGNLTFGASSCLDDDVNLQKAENFTRGLDNICNMLRKKHEEVKELQVLSIINNNALLFLYNPMLEEKIQELQKFASRLLLMEI